MQTLHPKHGKLSNHQISQIRIGIQKIMKIPHHPSLSQIGTLHDNKYIKANSMLIHSRSVHDLQFTPNPLI